MNVEIDSDSGFCFGVVNAIHKAEEALAVSGTLYCLGDIVHNSDEVQRLSDNGLRVITHAEMAELSDTKVLLRAHGEPPSTYRLAEENRIEIVDATCPVVLKLQQRIKQSYTAHGEERPQIVIYGKKGHAEVNGLVGQTNGEAIVVENVDELDKVDYTRPVALYSQTTKSLAGFKEIITEIEKRMKPGVKFESFDTICRQVANRTENIKRFASGHSVILFVSGKKSSNGKVLYANCKEVNPRSYLVANASEVNPEWLKGAISVGICGATSTPRWLMEQVKECVLALTE